MSDKVYIHSKHSGHVLDVEHGNISAGARVIQWPKKGDGSVNQHWIFTPEGYIATASDPNLVIDIQGGGGAGTELILWHKKPYHDAHNQLWEVVGDQIRNKHNHSLLLDIPAASTHEGTGIIVWSPTGGNNQKWSVQGHGGRRGDISHQTEYFIQSDHSGHVLSIEGDYPGAKVIISHKNEHAANQRWILDQHGFLLSAANRSLALDIANEGDAGTELIVWNKKDDYAWNQKWSVTSEGFIRNQDRDLVLDVYGAQTQPGTRVIVWNSKSHDNINQKWHLIPYSATAQHTPSAPSYNPVNLDKHTTVDLSKHNTVDLSKHTTVDLSKHTTVDLSKHTTADLSKHTTVDLSKHTTVNFDKPVSLDKYVTVNDNRHKDYWTDIDSVLDQIIRHANELKGHTHTVRGQYDTFFKQREEGLVRVHADRERLEEQLRAAEGRNRGEYDRLQQLLNAKEAEERSKVSEYDRLIHDAIAAKERAQREVEEQRGGADAERRKIASLLQDLENDALSYSRFRPSKPLLNSEEVEILRQLFLSSAASAAGGKLSFSDLKKIIAKYEVSEPSGNLKKLFQLVENDTKGRMSYITVVAVANDLAALVGDFRTIDTNGNGTLSRKEFREHFTKLGFSHRSALDKLFAFGDEDESDDITFHEFIHLSVTLLVLRILFSAADYDKNGKLSKDEIQRILNEAAIPPSTLGKFDHWYSVVDKDDSKFLDYVEFVQLVLSMFADD